MTVTLVVWFSGTRMIYWDSFESDRLDWCVRGALDCILKLVNMSLNPHIDLLLVGQLSFHE